MHLLRRNRDYRALFVAQVVSFCGDWFAVVAVLGDLHDLTDSAFVLAAFWAIQSVAPFLLTPIAGAVVDRYDRRSVLVTVSLVQAAAALLFLLVGPGRWAIAFVAEGLISGLGAFVLPATQAAVPNLVDEPDLRTASTLMSATWGAMLAVGAALGGAFTVAFGRDAAYLADAASFVVAAALVLSVRRAMQATSAEHRAGRGPMNPLADTAAALRVARRDPTLLALLVSKAGFGLSAGAVAMLAVLAATRYGGGDGTTGLLLGARGVGALLGPVVAARLIKRGDQAATVLLLCGLAGFAFAAGYSLTAVAPVIALGVVGVFVAHAGGGVQWTLSTYGLQFASPDAYRGRILSADFALVTFSMTVSFLAAGLLEGAVGLTATLLVLAAVSASWSVAYLGLQRRLRRPAAA